MNLLDSRFVYVPAGRQDQDGVLARWNKHREAERELAAKVSLSGTNPPPDHQTNAG